jgi:biotin transport system substrate-specific component
MEFETKYKTIYDILFKQKNILIDMFMIALSIVLMAIMANIRIPLWPVPITMQTFGIFLIAFFFGSRKGSVAMLGYILTGVVGFGVFAGYKSGLSVIMGPTGGYILGFLVCVFVVGMMIERGHGRTKTSVLLCMVIGNAIVYAFGLVGLWLYLGNIGLWNILMAGFIPFLIGDALKILAAVGLFPYLWKGSEKLVS